MPYKYSVSMMTCTVMGFFETSSFTYKLASTCTNGSQVMLTSSQMWTQGACEFLVSHSHLLIQLSHSTEGKLNRRVGNAFYNRLLT